MADNITVDPGTSVGAVSVRTTDRSGVHVPHVFSEAAGTASAASIATVSNSAGQVLAANTARMRVFLQNCGTTILYLLFGVGTPSATSYHIALAPCAAAHDGTGGYFETEWTGAIQAIGSNTGGKLSVVELSL